MSAAPSRSLRIALFASLALNAVLLGTGIAWLARPALQEPPTIAPAPAPSAETRPPRGDHDDRARYRAAAAPHRARIRAHAAELRSAADDVGTALRAEPFDAERLVEAFAALRAAEAEAASASQRMLVELADSLDAEGRARLAERIERRRGAGRRGPGPRATRD